MRWIFSNFDWLICAAGSQFSRSIRGLSSVIETGPIEEIASSARLVSINVRPESDGLVRRLHYSDIWQGQYVPSLAAALVTPGRFLDGSFYIDFGIDVSSIPVISFADLLTDRFDERRIRGKTVLIGSTAIELGDQNRGSDSQGLARCFG